MGKLKEYFNGELNSSILHAITGIIAGYLSFTMNSVGLAVVVMIVILAISMALTKVAIQSEKKDAKWWLGNGVIVYILLWIVVWTIYYNIAIR